MLIAQHIIKHLADWPGYEPHSVTQYAHHSSAVVTNKQSIGLAQGLRDNFTCSGTAQSPYSKGAHSGCPPCVQEVNMDPWHPGKSSSHACTALSFHVRLV